MEPEYVARGWWGNDTLSGWLARHAAGRLGRFVRRRSDHVEVLGRSGPLRGPGPDSALPQAKEMFEGRGIAFHEIQTGERFDGRTASHPADPFLLIKGRLRLP